MINAVDSKFVVSVIIPTKNEEQVINECLSSVFNQSLKPFEVIIVDGRSADSTLKEARQFPVKVLTETEPSSLPNARNIGIRAAKGNIIFIMDADVILDKNCLRNALKYFEDPGTIAVVPSEHNVAHSRIEKIQIEWIKGGTNPLRPGIGISVFAEFLRKSVFTNLMFDPNLGYGEDEDFQHRLRSFYGISGKVMHSSDSIISVHYSHTLKELRSQYTWYGRTFKTFLRKNFLLKPLLNLGSLLAPSLLIILGFLSLVFFQAIPFFVLLTALIVARNLLICYHSRSFSFFEYIGFEFLRSFFFTKGLLQGLLSKERGR